MRLATRPSRIARIAGIPAAHDASKLMDRPAFRAASKSSAPRSASAACRDPAAIYYDGAFHLFYT